jgi:chloramphenicol-sensitive protein RarD
LPVINVVAILKIEVEETFVTLGLLQFLAPSLQFVTGLAFGEPFTPLRAASFALIWVGLALFSWDTLRRARMHE